MNSNIDAEITALLHESAQKTEPDLKVCGLYIENLPYPKLARLFDLLRARFLTVEAEEQE